MAALIGRRVKVAKAKRLKLTWLISVLCARKCRAHIESDAVR
jgi:hypothetical protein